MKNLILTIVTFIAFSGYVYSQESTSNNKSMKKSDTEWKEILSPQEYFVLREKGTDRASDDGYTKHFEKGTYVCTACGNQLFESNTKYESHCGWPSFDDAIKGTVEQTVDRSHGMIRTEITCKACDSHLGHIFDDGPKDTTGKRYCVNTTSIKFVKAKSQK